MRRFAALLSLAVPAAPAAAAHHEPAAAGAHHDPCSGHRHRGVMCAAGHGRRTRGGSGKVSHAGWPAVTGILWIVRPAAHGRADEGTPDNDELLGSHGDDVLGGGVGEDILWGDHLPTRNNTWQHDVIGGGPGDDWIYSSHGRNEVDGGPGDDHIWGHFGHGAIDCGDGHDVVHVKHRSTYELRNCEKVLHH